MFGLSIQNPFVPLVRDDGGRQVELCPSSDLFESSGWRFWKRPTSTYNIEEPYATEYAVKMRTHILQCVVPVSLWVFFYAVKLGASNLLPHEMAVWTERFASVWLVLLLVAALQIPVMLVSRRLHGQRLRAAYLAAHRCPACSNSLTAEPDQRGLVACQAEDCGACWRLPEPRDKRYPALPAHPLHCPHCEYDLKGVALFSPCPECGFALEPGSLRGPVLKTFPKPRLKPNEKPHPDSVPPWQLAGPDRARYNQGLCPYCGYSREGHTPHLPCPECASTIARRAPRPDDPPPRGTSPACARCGFDMRGREKRTCPECGVMNGIKWVDAPESAERT